MNRAKWNELFEIIDQIRKDRGDKNAEDKDPIIAAEHDIIYLDFTTNDVSKDSELGKRLIDDFWLTVEYDVWCKYT